MHGTEALKVLQAFVAKVPPRGEVEQQAHRAIRVLMVEWAVLNDAAVRGELQPGFWGRFSARLQIILRRVRDRALNRVRALEQELDDLGPMPALECSNGEALDKTLHIYERKAAHRVWREVYDALMEQERARTET